MIPRLFATFFTFAMTSSCTKLKLIASSAMPNSKYKLQMAMLCCCNVLSPAFLCERNKREQKFSHTPSLSIYERKKTMEKTHLSRHKVPKSNRGKCDEAEIRSIEEIPLLRSTEKVSSAEYIADDEKNAEPDWHGPNRRI